MLCQLGFGNCCLDFLLDFSLFGPVMKTGLTSDELGQDSSQVELLIEKHQEKKKEIDNKDEKLDY